MKITINTDLCIGCSLCEENAPEVFKMKDNTAAVIGDNIGNEFADRIKEMVEDCPAGAIEMFED